MEREEKKISGEEIAPRSRFLSALENFWYHYKWTVIISAFFLITFTIGFVQCAGRETADITVNYSGGRVLSAEERDAIREVLCAVAPKDAKSGERMSALLTDYAIYDEEALRQMYLDEDGNLLTTAYNAAKNVNTNNIKTLSTYIMTGDCSVWLVSPYVYEQQGLSTLAAPLSETLGSTPEGAYDAYAVRLGDTAFYAYYDAVKVLPADTLIILTQPFVYGTSSNKETYAAARALYLAIVDFRAP